MQKQNVDYRNLTGSPSPEEFFLLSRVHGTVSVGQLCSVSGLPRAQTIASLERLIEFGLLVPAGDAPHPSAKPRISKEHQVARPQQSTHPGPPDAPRMATHSPAAEPVRTRPAFMADDDSDDLLGAAAPAQPMRQEAVPRKTSHSSFVPVVSSDGTDLFEAGSPVFGGQSVDDSELRADSPALDARPQRNTYPVVDDEPLFEIEHTAYSMVSDDDADDELFGVHPPEPPSEVIAAPRVSLFDDDPPTPAARPASQPVAAAASGLSAASGPLAADVPEVVGLCHTPISWEDFEPDPDLMALSVEIDDLRKREILFMYENMPHMTYYDLFGVDVDVDRRAVKKAYITLSKRYHPDLFFRKEVGEFGARAESLFKWVTKAFQTLQNPQKRAAYDESLRPAQELGPEPLAAKREAAFYVLLRRGERLEKAGNFSDAVDEYRKALSLQRDTNVILRCAILLLRAGIRLDEAAMYARALLGYDPNHLEGLVVLGSIYERNGMLDDALDAFERAWVASGNDPSITVHVERVRSLMGAG